MNRILAHLACIPWALARAGGHGVVPQKVLAGSGRRIEIPNACVGTNLRCMTPCGMSRRERARFILDAGGHAR